MDQEQWLHQCQSTTRESTASPTHEQKIQLRTKSRKFETANRIWYIWIWNHKNNWRILGETGSLQGLHKLMPSLKWWRSNIRSNHTCELMAAKASCASWGCITRITKVFGSCWSRTLLSCTKSIVEFSPFSSITRFTGIAPLTDCIANNKIQWFSKPSRKRHEVERRRILMRPSVDIIFVRMDYWPRWCLWQDSLSSTV